LSEGSRGERGPGVPEALPRTLDRIGTVLGAEVLDTLWIFPPLIKGRKEWGLVVASCFVEQGERRRLFTARYSAERTGKGLDVESEISEQGEAPADRFPRMMEGVVRRSAVELGDPTEVVIEGAPDQFRSLMAGFDPAFLETVEP
jgi:hypothetical protein